MGIRRRQAPHTSCARGFWALVLLPRAVCQTGQPGTESACPKSEWVDPQTPSSQCVSQFDSAGRPLTLVFSDEFNIPGRTFADGHDPVWTAVTGFPSTKSKDNAYDDSPAHATTSDGNLWLRISNRASQLDVFDSSGKKEIKKRPYTSAMLQSWNKFCFSGGVVEMSAKFPGRPDIPGLGPAFRLLGNLGRATVEASLNNVWPYTYSQCPSDQMDKANQYPRTQQRINKCLDENWTQRFGLHPHQGRGALEIDILEVSPGSYAPNYKKDKVDTGICQPQSEVLYSKLDMPRPHLLNTLQVAPGIPFLADQRPPSPPRLNTTCVPEWGKQWYDGLRPEAPGVYGKASTINYRNYGTYIENNIHEGTDVQIQVDSLGAMTQLSEDAFSGQHVYRFEWSTEGDGQLTFWMDGQLLYRLDGKVLAQPMAISKDNGEMVGTLLARQLLHEPLSMILNIDLVGWDINEEECEGYCGCCVDCGDPECIVCMLEKGKGHNLLFQLCRTLPATYEVDYIRVFQTKDQQAEDRQGCSPKVAPTQGWIDSQRSRYVLPNFDAPLQPVYAGGGRCVKDVNCGSYSGGGTCVDGVCKCAKGWTGPSCLARMAGAALTCRPLEAMLVGGGPCFVNSTHDNCRQGTCIKINRPWDAPWQTVEHFPSLNEPTGTGDGRCQCNPGWKGPFCTRTGQVDDKNISWEEKTCVPDSRLSSPELEALIAKLCRSWSMDKESAERVSEVCSEIAWTSGGRFSKCGSWPRASLLLEAVKKEKGICCTSLNSLDCFEDEAQRRLPFGLLVAVLACFVASFGLLGCVCHGRARKFQGQAEESKRHFPNPLAVLPSLTFTTLPISAKPLIFTWQSRMTAEWPQGKVQNLAVAEDAFEANGRHYRFRHAECRQFAWEDGTIQKVERIEKNVVCWTTEHQRLEWRRFRWVCTPQCRVEGHHDMQPQFTEAYRCKSCLQHQADEKHWLCPQHQVHLCPNCAELPPEVPTLGVAATYVVNIFPPLASRATGTENPNFYEICPLLAHGQRGLGYNRICPRDRRPHCSMVDALDDVYSGKVTHFVSWCWAYSLNNVVSAVEGWLRNSGEDSREVFLWMCFFCNNQYRIREEATQTGSQDLREIFESHLVEAGQMLLLLDTILQPTYVTRAWCIFESYVCIARDIPMSIILPGAAQNFFRETMRGGQIDVLSQAVHDLNVGNARASSAADEDMIKRIIFTTIGFDVVNRAVRTRLVDQLTFLFRDLLMQRPP